MKNKIKLLSALFVIFVMIVVGQIILLKLKKEGTLEINSSPEASVFLDSNLIGKTPLTKTKLKEGQYSLKLVPENVATTTASWSGNVILRANKVTSVDRELGSDDNASSGVVVEVDKAEGVTKNTGVIEIDSEPSGAIVYLDSEEQKTTPTTLSDIEIGDHELAVFSPGFFRRSQKIQIEKTGDKIIAKFKLAVDPTYKKVDVNPVVEIEGSASAQTTKNKTETINEKAKAETGSVVIKDTPTGWLRVRKDANLTGTELAKVNSGETFKKISSKTSWVEIEYASGKTGWVSSQYVSDVKSNSGSTPTPKAKTTPTLTPSTSKKPSPTTAP